MLVRDQIFRCIENSVLARVEANEILKTYYKEELSDGLTG